MQVPGLSGVTVTENVGPVPELAEKLAIGTVAHVLVSVIVPV